MKNKYRITIDFESERPLDELCWKHSREAMSVAISHIVYPKWCGTIVVTSSGMEVLNKDEPQTVMDPKAKDALQRVVRHMMLMLEARAQASQILGRTVNCEDGETLAAILPDPSRTANLN